jgi:hypothetical protein
MIVEAKQQYRGVLCLHCHQARKVAVPESGRHLVAVLAMYTLEGGSIGFDSAPLSFITSSTRSVASVRFMLDFPIAVSPFSPIQKSV